MPTASNKPTTPRATPGFLGTLRDVLFEATPSVSVSAAGQAASATAASSADLEAARATLRQSLEAALGPGVREFALQVEALREVLPDAKQRQRAALRVLSLKGVAPPALVLELEQALTLLSQQNEAFSGKLTARRAAIEQERARAIEACRAETAETEQAIAQLQTELDAARARLTEATARRAQTLAECDEHAARLAEKQHGFERAFSDLQGEYASLQRQLSNAESV